ncbi:HepT-like ribonuclease domain-containing protein [Hydrogenimonas sp.]
MYSEKALNRIANIRKKIGFINGIVAEYGSVHQALEDEAKGRAAILMHLTSIAEQFDKLLHSGELELLSYFDKQDIKGSYDLRNFIAHDYEGVDLFVVEDVIKKRLPVISNAVQQILDRFK